MEKASAIKSLAISACAILLVVACVFGLAACGGYSTGGVEAGNFKGTTTLPAVDGSALKVEGVKPAADVDYAIKLSGSVAEASESDFVAWFGEEAYAEATADEAKAGMVCIKVTFEKAVLDDANAVIKLNDKGNLDKSTIIKDALDGDDFMYLIFNLNGDQKTEFAIEYTATDAEEATVVNYTVDMTAVTVTEAAAK